MNCSFDTIVAGAGLAGACSALALSGTGDVLLTDPGGPAAGASGIGPGLANPLMARKGTPAWRADEAVTAVRDLAERVGCPLSGREVVRPAIGKRQARYFRRTAEDHPALATWVEPDEAADRWPWLGMEFGVLLARGGGACAMPDFVEAVVGRALAEGCTVRRDRVTGWQDDADGVDVRFAHGEMCRASRLLLCTGSDTPGLPGFRDQGLRLVKGQTVRIRRPAGLPPLPPISAKGYVVDEEDTLFIGSTYEHDFDHVEPTPGAGERLARRASRVIPALAGAEIVGRYAAVRAAPPGRRMPILGPVGPHGRVWVFTGLGSRGLLLAPLLSAEIPRYFLNPDTIPSDLTLP